VKKQSMIPYVIASILWVPIGGLLGWVAHQAFSPQSGGEFTTPQPDALETAPAFDGASFNWVGGGTFKVGPEAPPGEYMVTATDTTFGCEWYRLKALDGKPKSEIEAGKVFRGDFAVVLVARGDKYFKLRGNCTWKGDHL
jgi:hypothetical protein